MKNLNLFALFALITAALLFMFSCNKVEITNNPDDIYDEEKTDSSGLLVKEKTYPYGENDVLLLSVNNPTDKNLSVTINVSYFDNENNLLKEDARTYDQMYSGGGNNFIFNPGIGFDSYSYSISAEEYNGTVIAKDVELNFSDLKRELGRTSEGTFAEVVSKTELSYNGSLSSVMIGADFILIDKNGELYGMYSIGRGSVIYSGILNHKSVSILKSETENISLPEELNGNISIIYDLTKIEPYGDELNDTTNDNSQNNETTSGLPDGFIIEYKKEYTFTIEGYGKSTYSLIYIKNETGKDYHLNCRTFTYENDKSLGSAGTSMCGNYSSGYDNYLWMMKDVLTNDGTLAEYKYEFFVSNTKGENVGLYLEFDNASRQTSELYNGEPVIIGELRQKNDVALNNMYMSVEIIGIDKSGNICCMGSFGGMINGKVSKKLTLKYVDTDNTTPAEDMEYIVAINRVHHVE